MWKGHFHPHWRTGTKTLSDYRPKALTAAEAWIQNERTGLFTQSDQLGHPVVKISEKKASKKDSNTHTHTHTNSQTDTHTHTHTHRARERER